MKGLALVKFKKDCLDLPEKQYKVIRVKPTAETLRSAALLKSTSPRVIQYLTLMRELSDGFQYKEIRGELVTCELCKGTKEIEVEVPLTDIDPMMTSEELIDSGFKKEIMECDHCHGIGKIHRMEQITEEVVSCPKDEVFIDLLDENEDVGRFIVWGGFKGTIDRLVRMAQQHGWTVLRVDGRGYHGYDPLNGKVDAKELLNAMDLSHPDFKNLKEKYPKVCFVGHPKAGGMALTLTGSMVELFFSNAFDGEARMQAEDRFHRAGMDANRGGMIIDLIHLKTDILVLENLKQKKKLQALSMGDLETAMKNINEDQIERR
jgi:SNF2 family DNA or RNA helicase